MTIEDKATNYRRMLAYLGDLGADLGPHPDAHLAKLQAVSFEEMDQSDLLHYQRVLEATIDNKSDLMDSSAMKEELTEVVRERFMRGAVTDKTAEAREFRQRLASL